jgi:hypothetical protein
MAIATPRRRPRAAGQCAAFRLGPTEYTLLTGLGRYIYLTAAQCTRRAYQPGSLRFVQKRLAGLVDAGYAQRHLGFTRNGKPPDVFSLTARGWDAVRELGMETPARWRPSEAAQRGFLAYAHDLAVADFGIATERFCTAVAPHADLAQVRHHRVLQADPLHVRLAGGRTHQVIFDAWLDLRLTRGEPPRQRQRALALELDRASEYQQVWRRKITAILAASTSSYAAHFGTTSLTVVVVCPGNARRVEQLLAWTEAQLRAESAEAAASLFAFTDVDPGTCDPQALFLDSCWRVPFGDVATALVTLDAPMS